MSPDPTAGAGSPDVRVVLVDDTPDLRLLVRSALEGTPGFTVVGEAGDGQAGVAAAARYQPDVVLLDLAMPIMDGLEALPLIRKASPETRVIVLSAFESGRMSPAALAAGADGYLQKGATPTTIVSTINDLLGGGQVPYAPPTPKEPLPESVDASDEASELDATLATAAHELRSPATILVGLAQTLMRRREALDEDTVTQLLGAIVRQTQVLDRVTGDLLTSVQAQRGMVALAVESMPLSPALEGIELSVRERAEVHIDCPADLWVCADRVRVDQMLGNLLTNALKYGQPPLRMVAVRSKSSVNVYVIDRGPGVPEDFRQQLFDRYSRANGLRASGTGLGLYVVKSLAEAQGGQAWYEPAEGGGSSFGFSLPLSAEPVSDARDAGETEPAGVG